MTTHRTIPFVTIALLATTASAYVAELADGGMVACERFGFTPAHPTLATALTSVFVHDPDHVAHIAGNMLVLAVLGAVVEPALGRWRLVALYLAAGLGGAALHWLVQPDSEVVLVGASGSIVGLMAAGAVVRPRLLAFVVSYVGMNLVGLYASTSLVSTGVSVGAHVGGFCVGVAFMLAGRVQGMRWAAAETVG